jgi:hypothetical protein
MPGPPTQIQLLDLVKPHLLAAPEAELQRAGTAIDHEPGYAALGAIGPALADFIPSDLTPGLIGGASPFVTLWRTIFAIAGGDGTPAAPGLFNVLERMTDFLDKVDAIAAAEDTGALKDMRDSGEIDTITQTAEELKTIVADIPTKVSGIAAAIGNGMKPAVTVNVGETPPPYPTWSAREFLCWKDPGTFSARLVKNALDSGDERFIAYAYGYLISYAAHVCGSSFINSSVGSVYRLHWWRKRWIDLYVDAWVWGYYGAGATMAGDTPSPPYAAWRNLCNANLQDRVDIGAPLDPSDLMERVRTAAALPAALPGDFADFWFDAFSDAYGAEAAASRITKESLNAAYQLTRLMLWFQHSGSVLGCNPAPPVGPPPDCGDTPSWTDPTVPGDDGSSQPPPSPSVDTDPDVGEIISGVVLILLGAATILTGGGLIFGAAEIAAGATLIVDGATQLDWAKLRCDLYWYRVYLYNGLKALHKIMVLGGFAHPYSNELAADEAVLTLLGIPFTHDSGKKNVKSRFSREDFPRGARGGTPATWGQRPTQATELPSMVAYTIEAYPDFFIDSAANPLSNGDILTGGKWPPGYRLDAAGDTPTQFGNAAENLLDVIRRWTGALPSWNLDADRGLAHLTWEFAGAYSSPVVIQAEP